MINSSTTSISLTACAKTFGDGTRALDPVNLEIKGGETLVLLGPSGCGKTTLLRIIAGLEMPDFGGRVLFNDEDVTEHLIENRNVGMVFQSYALFPNMTVIENIAYGLRVRKMASVDISARVDEMLDMMRISELRHRRIDQLSGGQCQRVALARAIAVRPRVLLLDEPLTALDALLRDRLRVEIDSLLRSLGITSIYVTHDQAEAMALGDRVVVMSKGRIAQIGSPRDIYHYPANEFVADFIGTVNRLPAVLLTGLNENQDGDVLFRPEDAEIVGVEEAHFIGRVNSSFFLGDRTRLILDAGGDAPVVIESSFREPVEIGAKIPIRIRSDGFMKLEKPTNESS